MKIRYYTGHGLIGGELLGGSLGVYDSRHYSSDTIEDLKEQITKDFQSGDLDSDCGLGFERLVAARIDLIEEATIEVNGRKFISKQFVEKFKLGKKKYLKWLKEFE